MPVSTEDYMAISDHLARYCWAVDEGDSEAWVRTWVEDGVFTGVSVDPIVGRAALAHVPEQSFAIANGGVRHMAANLFCEYGDDRDTVNAQYYNMITKWEHPPTLMAMALSRAVLVRDGAGWLIKRNDIVMLPQME